MCERRPTFFYDFNSPYAYLAAERISALFKQAGAEQPLWRPISLAFVLRASGRTPWSLQSDRSRVGGQQEIARRAADRGLPEVRYPAGWPVESYSLTPLRAATYAEQTGRLIAFSLAAFRQQFAAGRPLSDPENVVLAAAACELHPKAVLKAIETDSIKQTLRRRTEEAIELGVPGVPTVAIGEQLFWGDDRLEEAAHAAAA
jgi:2-hydroxychromene-2-carboxylate isomerase